MLFLGHDTGQAQIQMQIGGRLAEIERMLTCSGLLKQFHEILLHVYRMKRNLLLIVEVAHALQSSEQPRKIRKL